EVVRKRHPLGQNLAQPPDASLLIELVFVAGAFRRIDHHVQALRIGVDWRQFLNWCRHLYTPIHRAEGVVHPPQGCKDNADQFPIRKSYSVARPARADGYPWDWRVRMQLRLRAAS